MFYPNPDYKSEIDITKDCHYASLVFGADKLFEILKQYYGENDGEIIGIEVTDASMNVYFKNKENENK